MKKSKKFKPAAEPKKNVVPVDPVANALLDALKECIEDFLAVPVAEQADAVLDLFNITWPSILSAADGPIEGYKVWPVQRSARMLHEDNTKHQRLSTDVVVTDKDTGTPMYFAQAYITPNDTGAVIVYCMDPNRGPSYQRTLRWNSGVKKARNKESVPASETVTDAAPVVDAEAGDAE